MGDGNGPTFACAACGREFKWKPELAGKKAKCKCGAAVSVPQKAPVAAPPPPPPLPEDDPFDFADMPEPIAPAPRAAPPLPPSSSQPQQIACPVCNTPAPPTAVLCTNCGYNFRTGVHMPGAGKGRSLAYAAKGASTGGGISADTYAQAAKAAWMAPIIAFVLGCCAGGPARQIPIASLVVSGFQLLLILGGLGLGIFALTGVRKHGSEGILVPAIVGLVLNLGIIALNVVMVIMLTSGKIQLPGAPRGPAATPPARTAPVAPAR